MGPLMSALRFLLTALCVLPLTTTKLTAQRLGGTVRDVDTGAAVAGASVTAIDARGVAHGTVISDSAGTFHFPLPRAEHYQCASITPNTRVTPRISFVCGAARASRSSCGLADS